MDFRKVYDSIPEHFDRWRPRYCSEVFEDVIEFSKLDHGKTVLEIGPGTGQATEPILKTGCDYLGIELGEKLAEYAAAKFSGYDNFKIINADFESHGFAESKFDLVYSAATIQWIPEEIGFPKIYEILTSGGTLAMMFTRTDEKTANKELYEKIQSVYRQHFFPKEEYTCKLEYENAVDYDFVDFECRKYNMTREFTALEYISYIKTHAPHITLGEPHKSRFYSRIREVVEKSGNKMILKDTIILYLARKP